MVYLYVAGAIAVGIFILSRTVRPQAQAGQHQKHGGHRSGTVSESASKLDKKLPTPVTVLLALALVAGLGAGGYALYSHNQQQNCNAANAHALAVGQPATGC